MRTAIGVFLLTLSVALFTGCSGDGKGGSTPSSDPDPEFVVDEAFAAELVDQGIPEDVARFFAAARVEATTPGPRSYRFLQTFPNGATRDLEFTFGETEAFTPTLEQVAAATESGIEIYPIGYTATAGGTEPVQIELSYFVPYTTMSQELQDALAGPASCSGTECLEFAGGDGATVIVQETTKKGVETAIASILDYFKDAGISAAGLLGSVFSIASALSDISAANDVSKEHQAWNGELDTLLFCVNNPTNPLAQSDPNYSSEKNAQLEALRAELKQLTAARFLNALTDTASGANPGLALVLKPGLTWNDQTLKEVSDGTVMREAREAIIACDYPFTAVLTFEFTNSYEICDDICHRYDESLTASATFLLEPTTFGGYLYEGAPTGGMIAMSDVSTLTDMRMLLPPYHAGDALRASTAPTIRAGGSPTVPPEKSVEVTAEATVPSTRSSTDVAYVNGAPTTQTTMQDLDVTMLVGCKFDHVVSMGGDYDGVVTDAGPFSVNDPTYQFAKASCKLNLTPVPVLP